MNDSLAADKPELSTPRELAKVLKVSPPTVMAYLRRGIIEAEIAVGRVYRFNPEKCVSMLRAHTQRQGD